MARFLSQPTSLVVYQAATATLGSGSDVGGYANNVWTPGRDSNGVVNQASWDLVPKGTWLRVAGSEMSALDGAVKAALPGWFDQNGWDQFVRNSWGGLIMDWWSGSRMWWTGGGHNASSNNGVYRFDHNKMRWAIEALPSNLSDPLEYDPAANYAQVRQNVYDETYAKWSANGGSTADPTKHGELKYENDTFSDQWGLGSKAKPWARHSYNWGVYAPNLNRIFLSARKFWSLNLTTSTWDYSRIIYDSIPGGFYVETGQSVIDPEHGTAMWDEVTNQYLAVSLGSSGKGASLVFNWNSKTWDNWTTPPAIWNDPCDTRAGRNVVWMNAGRGAGSNYPTDPQYVVYNLDSRTKISSGGVQYTGGWSRDQFYRQTNSSEFDNPALCYVPPLDRYWYWSAIPSPGGGNMISFFEVDPTTTPWTLSPKAFTGDVPVPHTILGRKLVYSQALNAVLFINDGTSPMYLYKF